jgi:hypothetical protein
LALTIFHEGVVVDEKFQAAPDVCLELTAVVSSALTAEERERFRRRLVVEPHPESVKTDYSANARWPLILYPAVTVCDVFKKFPEVARDDRPLVLAAVQMSASCFKAASKWCQDDEEIVAAAQVAQQ